MAKKETGTALAEAPLNGGYLALQSDGDAREAMLANLGDSASLTESDLKRVKIPSGGGTKWTIPSVSGDEMVDEIEGILAAICPRGVLWPQEEPKQGTLPLLRTDDLKIAYRVGPDNGDVKPDDLEKYHIVGSAEPPLYNWEAMTGDGGLFGFGSGKGGHGKRAKEQRVLFILRERDMFPLVITVQPGSLKAMKQFIVGLTAEGIPHYRAVVGLALKKETSAGGQMYSQIVPRLIGQLTPEQGSIVRRDYTERLKDLARRMTVEAEAAE